MMKTAVIDIDNTLWQFCDAFLDELKKVNSAFPPVARWDTWDFFTPYCTEEQFMAAVDAVHLRQDSDEHRPYPGARGFLRSLREQGYRVVIASHRKPEMAGPTERWLAKHGLPYDELHLSFDKSVLFKDAAVVVDDAPQTLVQQTKPDFALDRVAIVVQQPLHCVRVALLRPRHQLGKVPHRHQCRPP